MCSKYAIERAIFNRVASKAIVKPMSKATLERYSSPRWPHLFPKEMMFALAGDVRGKRILEIGCGEGVEAVQLAYCGADVTGLDISDISIDVARKRAAIEGFDVQFRTENIVEVATLGEEYFDVVWCNLILHHTVECLDSVVRKVKNALKTGGMFISREPVAYARWLKTVRNLFPVNNQEDLSDQQPLGAAEFSILYKHFPDIRMRHYRLMARVDCITNNLSLIRVLARLDNLLLRLPGSSSLAGDVVMWASKR